jgi:DNA-directed RNA polymerase subunit M/transcription elongation factor TFIIS
MGGMARDSTLSIVVAILLLPVFASTISASSASMVTAGSGGVAIIGLPGHQGDTVSFSSLIHNEGDSSGTAFLRLNSSNQTYVGEQVVIEPGSSREVVAPFLLSEIGLIDVYWEIISNDSLVSENLSGHSQINIEEPQELHVQILDSSWTSDDGLEISFRTILDEGRSRDVSVELTGYSGSNSQLLQSFESFLTPGIRQFSLSLGSPSISSVSIRLTPIDWISHDTAVDEIVVSPPEISGTIEIVSISPEIPSAADSVSIDVLISNTGTDRINSGTIRIISSSSGIVLAEMNSPSLQIGSDFTGTFSIESWPTGNPVDIRAEWYSEFLISEFDNSVISNNVVSSSSSDIPWITVALGCTIGILVSIAMRSASRGSRKSVSMKKTKKVDKKENIDLAVEEKREVYCPECNRALLVPKSYSGRARCAPPCSTEFEVSPEKTIVNDEVDIDHIEFDEDSSDEENESNLLVSKSKNDLLECPSCGQMLKVPISKRPATARCPACGSEFEALEG